MSLDALAHPSATLIWGLLSRGLGLVFLISFASLSVQLLPIAGARGITPAAAAFAALRRDFPGPRRFFYFPSLLWLSASDAMLAALPRLGMLAAVSCIVGGPHAPYAFALCYAIYLSLERPCVLVYPWDCVLFEAGFWGMLLPATHVLPSLHAVSAPAPAVAWVYRLLVFRVMLGFGKHKFLGSQKQDAGFLKTFLANQPLPTPLGLASQRLPMPFMKLGLFAMFVVEIPLPFAVFFPGVASSVAGVLLIGFMVAIWLSGNFGYFNVVVIVATLSWLDNTTANALSLSQATTFAFQLALLHTSLAALAFPFNTFCAQTWTLWSIWLRVPRVLTLPIVFARALHPLRFAHAYGVFPPRSAPPGRLMPVIEATWDDREWHTLRFRFAPSAEDSRPTWCAPHHERFDQAVVYEGLGLNESSVFRNIVGRWDPYGFGGVPATRMLLQRILHGDVPGDRFYDRSRERQHGAPLAVRARNYFFSPEPSAERRAQGFVFARALAGPHLGPARASDAPLGAALPTPEQWHYDDVIWLERSKLGPLMQRAERGEDIHTLVLRESDGLETGDVQRFFEDFLPTFAVRHASSFVGLRASVGELRARYDAQARQRLERVAARYAALLFARMRPLFLEGGLASLFGLRAAQLDAKSIHHLRLLACQIVLEGRAAIDRVMAEPESARAWLARFDLHAASCVRTLFRYEEIVYWAQRLRALDAFTQFENRVPPDAKAARTQQYLEGVVRRAWGCVEYGEFLKTQFRGEEDQLDVPEAWPHFAFTDDCDVVRTR